MSNPQTRPRSDDKQVCEATSCSNQATTELNIPVGEMGNLQIFVCDTCIKKFGFSSKAEYKEFKKK